MKGEVDRPTAKLLSYLLLEILCKFAMSARTQLLLPPILTPLARMLKGKTSDTTIHATGPASVSSSVRAQVRTALTPCVRKVDNEDPYEDHGSPASSLMILKLSRVRPDDAGNDKMADSHTDSSGDQNLFPADVIDPKNRGDGEDKFENTCDTGCEEGGSLAA